MSTKQIPKGKTIKLYKFLSDDFTGTCSGKPWPVKNGRTRWLKCEGKLELCENGYHGCEEKDLLKWALPQLYEMEARGEILRRDDKICCREVRLVKRVKTWNEKTQRLFAADCAEHVLHVFEKKYPDDKRPRTAIGVVRKFTRGQATGEELDAARVAAWDAVGGAAWVAARAAARAAAWDAAWAAAWDATWAVARDVERKWQRKRLMEYLKGKRK